MQSDPGAGTPHTGDDDEVWRDLVARLEEAEDAFLEDNSEGNTEDQGGPEVGGSPDAGGTPDSNTVSDTSTASAAGGSSNMGTALDSGAASPSGPGAETPKTVIDFDPLGVWHAQESPAPREPAAGNRFGQSPGAAGDGSAAFGPRDYEFDEDDDEGFVPEELPSLSASDPAIVLSWIGAAGGPLFSVFSAIFWRHAPMMLVVAVILAFIAGTCYLLFRLPHHRDDDGGDGAVV